MSNLKIFVSHSWADKTTSEQFGQLKQELKDFDLWIDTMGLGGGEALHPSLQKGILESDVFLILWSKNTAGAKNVLFELDTALSNKKLILPCIIDQDCIDKKFENEIYSVSRSKFAGLLYYDLTEQNAAVGWLKIKQRLIGLKMEKLSAELKDDPKKKTALKKLEKMQSDLQRLIGLIEDTNARIKGGAKNRDEKNAYTTNMLNEAINIFGAEGSSIEGKQVAEFMQYTKETFAAYPDGSPETKATRENLLFEKIIQLDPNGENEKLNFFKEALQNNLSTQKKEQPPQAKSDDYRRAALAIISNYRHEVDEKINGSYDLVKKATGGLIPDFIFKPLFQSIEYYFQSSIYQLEMLWKTSNDPNTHPFVRDCVDELLAYLNNPNGVINNASYGVLGYADDAYLILWVLEMLARKGYVDYSSWQINWDLVNNGCNQAFNLFEPAVKERLNTMINDLFAMLERKYAVQPDAQQGDLERQRAALEKSKQDLWTAKIMSLRSMM